ncbi:MAG: 1-deoxy-D-xylulose-5-phosphate synthase [Deltaproteobacteria bacterium]|nr:MAG: 1-deoxy-D-xylulose-5-phosphate synthase [Deltaproteobacteria bacterium]
MAILEKIENPEDIKTLSPAELTHLAAEIRQKIVEVVSRNGGHVAPSLGVVELTIALHYVFNSPRDKIIWDVGHQAYAHKLLTGRRDQFHTLRQYGGLSGFTKRSESPHDPFTTGHSSTSISAALGIASAKRIKSDPAKVIAVIGDGSMTAGLAYEALNQAGDMHKDLIVILNDNEMSIAPNVGALSSLLSRTFSAVRIQSMRKNFGEFLKKLPGIGDDVYQMAKRSEESFKTFVTPGMLFEAFDFDYFGPIDGHNMGHLIDILENIQNIKEPVLLHVNTIKGKGYAPAEKNPVYFHGCGQFEIESGTCLPKKAAPPSYTQVFARTLVTLAEKDDRIVAVTAAMPAGTGLSEFAGRFPGRFFDVGIAEPHGVTFAAGMATEGFKPVVAIYSTFLQRAYDQILHDVCIDALPVIFAVDRGGIVGEDGPTHHGLFDLSYLRCLPNMVIMSPKDENELRRMMVTALAHNGPVAIRYPRGASEGVEIDREIQPIEIGQSEILAQGDDLLILAIGRGVIEAMAARRRLRDEGIRATVVNSRYIKPLDTRTFVALAEKIPRIVTVEENVRIGGFGSAVLEGFADAGFSGFEMRRVGIDDTFVTHGPQEKLRNEYHVDKDAVIQAAHDLIQ